MTGVGDDARDELRAYLRSQGATDDQIDEAAAGGHLAGLATDVVLRRGANLTAADVAARTGQSVDQVIEVWRLLGVHVPAADVPTFTEEDAELVGMLLGFGNFLDAAQGEEGGNELLRIIGTSMARVAEAAVSVYVQTAETRLMDSGAGDIDVARDSAATVEVALELGERLGRVFSHHLADAIRRQRFSQSGIDERALARLAVGFVDLVGFTPLSRTLTPRELVALVNRFETRAFDVAADHGGRIVKHIGDEIMFVALDAVSGCNIARDLTRSFDEGDIKPRGGVAFGRVLTRHGDYYGEVVNLAARLTDAAIPGEVLVDEGVADATGEAIGYEPAGRRQLKGFDEPIRVYALR